MRWVGGGGGMKILLIKQINKTNEVKSLRGKLTNSDWDIEYVRFDELVPIDLDVIVHTSKIVGK